MKYLVLILFALSISCNQDEDIPIITPIGFSINSNYDTIEGVDQNLLSLKVFHYLNSTSIKPVIIYVHGGGWSIGDKDQQLDNKTNLFISMDYILVSINYRLSPFPFEINNPNRIQFPIHNKDVAKAIKWVYDHIDDYGGDKDKIAILGHSAGAHLVALTGTNSQFLEEVGLSLSNIKGVAVIDTQGYDVREQVLNGENQNMYINAFGTNEVQNRLASPIFNVVSGTNYPKFFITKRGSAERIAFADDFIEILNNNGVSVSQINGSIYDHAEINNAIGQQDETLITEPLKQFFIACFE